MRHLFEHLLFFAILAQLVDIAELHPIFIKVIGDIYMRFAASYIIAAACVSATPIPVMAQGAPTAGALLAADARQAGDRADDKAALSDQWKKGARMAANGEKLLKRSTRRLVESARDAKEFQAKADKASAAHTEEENSQAKGRQMIADGRSLQAQAEGKSHTGSGG